MQDSLHFCSIMFFYAIEWFQFKFWNLREWRHLWIVKWLIGWMTLFSGKSCNQELQHKWWFLLDLNLVTFLNLNHLIISPCWNLIPITCLPICLTQLNYSNFRLFSAWIICYLFAARSDYPSNSNLVCSKKIEQKSYKTLQ